VTEQRDWPPEQRDWPPEQSAKGTLRPWHDTAAGYLAALFEDAEEAQRAQRGLQQRGVPEGDLRLYDGEETLRIASRLQQERSILAKAIKEIVVDHRAERRWLGNARAGGSLLLIYAPAGSAPTGWWGCSPTTSTGRWTTSASTVWKSSNRMSARPRPGKAMIGMTRTITATSIQACNPGDAGQEHDHLEVIMFGSLGWRDAPPDASTAAARP
jgi:hypothetical protein